MLRGLTGRITAAALAALVTAGALGACGDGGGTGDGGGSGAPLRLGYFPNITHATALVGVEKGIFAKHLGTAPKTATFNAGVGAAGERRRGDARREQGGAFDDLLHDPLRCPGRTADSTGFRPRFRRAYNQN